MPGNALCFPSNKPTEQITNIALYERLQPSHPRGTGTKIVSGVMRSLLRTWGHVGGKGSHIVEGREHQTSGATLITHPIQRMAWRQMEWLSVPEDVAQYYWLAGLLRGWARASHGYLFRFSITKTCPAEILHQLNQMEYASRTSRCFQQNEAHRGARGGTATEPGFAGNALICVCSARPSTKLACLESKGAR